MCVLFPHDVTITFANIMSEQMGNIWRVKVWLRFIFEMHDSLFRPSESLTGFNLRVVLVMKCCFDPRSDTVLLRPLWWRSHLSLYCVLKKNLLDPNKAVLIITLCGCPLQRIWMCWECRIKIKTFLCRKFVALHLMCADLEMYALYPTGLCQPLNSISFP